MVPRCVNSLAKAMTVISWGCAQGMGLLLSYIPAILQTYRVANHLLDGRGKSSGGIPRPFKNYMIWCNHTVKSLAESHGLTSYGWL